jgi:O-antigen ligase
VFYFYSKPATKITLSLTGISGMDKISSRHIIHQRIFYYCCLALVFLLPVYGRVIPPIIALIVLNWLIEGRFIKTFPQVFKDRGRWWTFSFSLFYLLYLAGLLYSSNYQYGMFDLEIKLSLFVFPLLFSTLDKSMFNPTEIRSVCKMFVTGCFTGSVILLIHALFNKLLYNTENAFVYSNLSWSFHPSYFAAYLTFAIAIAADHLFLHHNTMNMKVKTGLIILVLFFFAVVFLLSSKAGIGSLFLLAFVYILLVMFRIKKIMAGIVLIIGSVLCFYAAFNLFPYAVMRIGKANTTATLNESSLGGDNSSTPERLIIWKNSWEIIRQHFITGVGTGNVKDELLKKYKEKNLKVLYEQKLNTHNQYLETFIALGIIGLLALLAMLILPAIRAVRTMNYLYFVFLVIFSFNILVESMLEIQAGVVFFAFFNSFFFRTGNGLGKSTNN